MLHNGKIVKYTNDRNTFEEWQKSAKISKCETVKYYSKKQQNLKKTNEKKSLTKF